VVRDIPENGVALAEEMKRRNLDFTNLAAVEQMAVDLISVGKLYLNPAAISAEFEQRYGDELYGAYQMSRVSAADLAVFTSRFVPTKQDESKLSADQYWHTPLATTAANIRIGWFAIPKKLPCWMNNN